MQDEQPTADGDFFGYPAAPVAYAPPVAPRRSGRRLIPSVLLVFLAAVVAAAVLGLPGPWRGEVRAGTAEGTGSAPVTSAPAVSAAATSPPAPALTAPLSGPPADRPTPDGGTTRLGAAPVPPIGGGPHAFATLQDNGVTPVAYDPCRQVHYVIRPDGAPADGEAMVQAAAARLSEATGLQFVYDGPTDEAPADDRSPYQPDRYGDRWAPVLVAWQTDAELPSLAGDVVGEGGSAAVSLGDGPRVYVTGSVVLDSGQFPAILKRRNGAAIAEGIVLHEFGHLAGLDHVDDDGQLMYPETVPGVTDYADGDLEGLARLGLGTCFPGL